MERLIVRDTAVGIGEVVVVTEVAEADTVVVVIMAETGITAVVVVVIDIMKVEIAVMNENHRDLATESEHLDLEVHLVKSTENRSTITNPLRLPDLITVPSNIQVDQNQLQDIREQDLALQLPDPHQKDRTDITADRDHPRLLKK